MVHQQSTTFFKHKHLFISQMEEGTDVVQVESVQLSYPGPGATIAFQLTLTNKQDIVCDIELKTIYITNPAKRHCDVVLRSTKLKELPRGESMAAFKTTLPDLHAGPSHEENANGMLAISCAWQQQEFAHIEFNVNVNDARYEIHSPGTISMLPIQWTS
jgi:ASF1 like histone chaperone